MTDATIVAMATVPLAVPRADTKASSATRARRE